MGENKRVDMVKGALERRLARVGLVVDKVWMSEHRPVVCRMSEHRPVVCISVQTDPMIYGEVALEDLDRGFSDAMDRIARQVYDHVKRLPLPLEQQLMMELRLTAVPGRSFWVNDNGYNKVHVGTDAGLVMEVDKLDVKEGELGALARTIWRMDEIWRKEYLDMAKTLQEVKDALHERTPKGRRLVFAGPASARCAFLAYSDRGFFSELDYERCARDPDGVAKQFWHAEAQTHEDLEVELSEYSNAIRQLEEAGKFDEMSEQLQELYPGLEWGMCVSMTDEMRDDVVVIAKSLLPNYHERDAIPAPRADGFDPESFMGAVRYGTLPGGAVVRLSHEDFLRLGTAATLSRNNRDWTMEGLESMKLYGPYGPVVIERIPTREEEKKSERKPFEVVAKHEHDQKEAEAATSFLNWFFSQATVRAGGVTYEQLSRRLASELRTVADWVTVCQHLAPELTSSLQAMETMEHPGCKEASQAALGSGSAGKIQYAELLAKTGRVKTPEQILEVFETGQVDSLLMADNETHEIPAGEISLEPECSCKGVEFGMGHEADCPWKRWKDAQ